MRYDLDQTNEEPDTLSFQKWIEPNFESQIMLSKIYSKILHVSKPAESLFVSKTLKSITHNNTNIS